jgi:hypothetical protein
MSEYMALHEPLIFFHTFIPDFLLMREIAYQTIRTGVTSFLMSNSKKLWPPFPVHIGNYSLLNGNMLEKKQRLCKIYVYAWEVKKDMTHMSWQ